MGVEVGAGQVEDILGPVKVIRSHGALRGVKDLLTEPLDAAHQLVAEPLPTVLPVAE